MQIILNFSTFISIIILSCLTVYGQVKDISTPSSGFDLEFQIEEENDGHYLVVQLNLAQGAYVISPFSNDGFYGSFDLSLNANNYIFLEGPLQESPESSLEIDPVLEKLVRFVRVNTSYKQKINNYSTGDFEIAGAVFLLLEPACIPYVVPYSLVQRNGKLSIRENDPQVHDSYRK